MNDYQLAKCKEKILSVLEDRGEVTTAEIVQATQLTFNIVNRALSDLQRENKVCSREQLHYIAPDTSGTEYLATFLLLLTGVLIGVNFL